MARLENLGKDSEILVRFIIPMSMYRHHDYC